MLIAPMIARLKAQKSLRAMLQILVRDVVALHGAEKGDLQLADAEGNLWLVSHQRMPRAFLEMAACVPPEGNTVCMRAWRAGKTTMLRDVRKEKAPGTLRNLSEIGGYRAVLSSPLVSSGGEAIGVVSALFANPKTPTDIEIDTLHTYCRRATDHVLSTSSAAELRQRAKELHEAMMRRPVRVE